MTINTDDNIVLPEIEPFFSGIRFFLLHYDLNCAIIFGLSEMGSPSIRV